MGKLKSETLWAVFGQEGRVMYWTVQTSRVLAIRAYEKGLEPEGDWRVDRKAHGLRCARVRLSPAGSQGVGDGK